MTRRAASSQATMTEVTEEEVMATSGRARLTAWAASVPSINGEGATEQRKAARRELSHVIGLCTSHLRLLLALCTHRSAHKPLGERFNQLSVASTLATEIGLEMEVQPTQQTHSVAPSDRLTAGGTQARMAEVDDEDEEDASSCASSPPVRANTVNVDLPPRRACSHPVLRSSLIPPALNVPCSCALLTGIP